MSSSLYKTILFLMISAGVLSTPVLGDTLLQPQTQDPGIRQDINNPDRLAGDKAVTAGDYAVAVSFFKNYLENARKKQDRITLKDAYERLLDALTLADLPDMATEYLNTFVREFPDEKNTSLVQMWQADILTLKKQYRDAAEIYHQLSSKLKVQDVLYPRIRFSYATVLKKLRDNKGAVAIFESLWQKDPQSPIGALAFEQMILSLCELKEYARVMELLKQNPPATQKEITKIQLLTAYLALSEDGVDATSGTWKHVMKKIPGQQPDPLAYLVASSYADAFLKQKNYSEALDTLRLAYTVSSNKEEQIETLDRIIAVIAAEGDKKKAAELTKNQLDFLMNPQIAAETKLKHAVLLRETGNIKEALELYKTVFSDLNKLTTPETARIRALYDYALLKGLSGELTETEKVIRDYFRDDPEKGEFLLGEILIKLQKPEKFIPLYESIATRWKKSAERALITAAEAALDARKNNEVLRLIKKLKELALTPASHAKLFYLEAAALFGKEKNLRIVTLYDEFLKLADKKDPLIPKALYHSGLIEFTSRHFDSAEERFARLCQEYPEHELMQQAASWRIRIYYQLGKEKEAVQATRLLAEKFHDTPLTVDALFRLAKYYAENGKKLKAREELQRLTGTEHYPKIRARALFELAYLDFQSGNTANAEKTVRQFIKDFPDNPLIAEVHYLQGDILRSRQKFPAAVKEYEMASKLRPGSLLECSALGSIGDCLLAKVSTISQDSQKEIQKAVDVYKQMMNLPVCPRDFKIMGLFNSGRAMEQLKQSEKAAVCYKQALYLLPPEEAVNYPSETEWCVRAAEALIELAKRKTVVQTVTDARTALLWLRDAKIIPHYLAVERFENLKKENTKFLKGTDQ
ncbi:MAG: tetratricopeptide repeat protein [Lentisphaeria bacterium]|nr:tetratricopeptide repeat protein [Lentisphaeria bacterium]